MKFLKWGFVVAVLFLASLGTTYVGTAKEAVRVESLAYAPGDTITLEQGNLVRIRGMSGAFKWSSVDKNVVAILPSGVLKAVSVGETWLVASYHGMSDSVMVKVVDTTPPAQVSGLGQTIDKLSDSAFGVTINWATPADAKTFNYSVSVGNSVVAEGVSQSSPVAIAKIVKNAESSYKVCVAAVDASGNKSADTCGTYPVPYADSVAIRFFKDTDTSFAQGTTGATLEVGQTLGVCAYAYNAGKVIQDANITWTVSDTSVVTLTPTSDLASYTTRCLSKLDQSKIWQMP